MENGNLALALEMQQAGRIGEAKAQCLEVLRQAPKHPAALNLLGFLEHQAGNGQESIDAFRAAIAAQPDFADAHFNLGNIYSFHARPKEAAAAYAAYLALNPQDAAAHFQLAAALIALGDWQRALAALQATLRLAPDNRDGWTNLGYALKKLGRYEDSAEALRHAIALAPDSAECHNNLSTVLRDLRRPDEAAACFRTALALKPGFIEAENILGHALFDQGETDDAIAAFRRALERAPGDLASCINLAGLGERANRLDIAREAIARGLAISPDDASLHLLAAKCERREGNTAAAVQRLEKISGADARIAIDIAFELGQLHDRLDAPERAFAAFTEGNRLASELPAHRAVDKNEFRGLIRAIDRTLTPDWLAHWDEMPPAENPPAFLVGFPRSGTTLTEQILAAYPALSTIDEKSTLDAVLAEVVGYPAGLAALSAEQIDGLRGLYGDAAGPFAEPGKRIVDKMPLNIVHAAAIHRLFPGARIVLVLRHPCDAVLSGFMQNFTINSAMANFFSLADAAQLYSETMGLWRKSADLLPLDFHIVKYEALVGDFETETRKLLSFLGLDWNPAVSDFAARARERGRIDTPSYHQVTQEIYRHAAYRWRRYAEHFAALRPVLEPFVREFGYAWD
jgi:tetratricopeptide (TPR) repeat protein